MAFNFCTSEKKNESVYWISSNWPFNNSLERLRKRLTKAWQNINKSNLAQGSWKFINFDYAHLAKEYDICQPLCVIDSMSLCRRLDWCAPDWWRRLILNCQAKGIHIWVCCEFDNVSFTLDKKFNPPTVLSWCISPLWCFGKVFWHNSSDSNQKY